jgi:5-methylcytosine-specific restriction endonuclease McrA
MKEKIEEIRRILDDLESAQPSENETALKRNFSAFELPEIISDIVDYLMPLLKPYETAIYWYAFRHSILKNGDQYVRLSTNALQSGIVVSMAGHGKTLAQATVRDSLADLGNKGALRKESEPTKQGTLYKVMIPEEIEECRKLMLQKEKKEHTVVDIKTEADYYNVKENRFKIYERDEYKCHYCSKQLTRFTATLDHVKAVAEGGDNSYENLITACLTCNSRKNKKLLGDFLAEQG